MRNKIFIYKVKKFSLIELLIVISILSILASLLVPVVRKSMNQAQYLICTNNMKQTGFIMSVYRDDWNGWLMSSIGPNLIERMVGSTAYWAMPSDAEPMMAIGHWSPDHPLVCPTYWANGKLCWQVNGYLMSYTHNQNVGPNNPDHGNQLMKINQVIDPSVHSVLVDGSVNGVVLYQQTLLHTRVITDIGDIAIHDGKSNYLYFDGHVGWREKMLVYGQSNSFWRFIFK